MQSPLGFLLRQVRQSRHLSQAQAAQAAGIGRITLNRWEVGVQQPRLVELEALLVALIASPQERQQALELLNTPQARAHIRDILVRVGEQKGIGPMPHGGELLRALRLRRGLSTEETAKQIGVTGRTLRRWEKIEAWPSSDQLQTLCYTLTASTEELLALTTGHLSALSATGVVALDELRLQGHNLHFFTTDWQGQSLKELSYISLEAQAWPFAAQSLAGQQVLATLYSHHAQHLSTHKRFVESGVYAERALELWPKAHPHMVQASIALARSAVHRGTQRTPQRGLEVLFHWLREVRWPEYEAWLLSEIAAYTTQEGNRERGLQLAQQATAIAARSENVHELYNRELDEARLLLAVGQPRQALLLIQRQRPDPFLDQPAKFALLEVEAYLSLDEPTPAHDRLQAARQLIEAGAFGHLESKAQALTLRF